jgi:hypothetical protein
VITPIGTQSPSRAHANSQVLKWIDYSKKYGVGYTLSDQSVGVFFNDKTSLVFGGKENKLQSVTKSKDPESKKKIDVVNEVDTTQTSKDLDKKVKLIENFKIYLANKDKGNSSALSLLTT